MPISSLIIRTTKDKTNEVAAHLGAMKETSVSEVYDENIVIITETDAQSTDKSMWNEIEKIPGVVQCDLIYHNFEDQGGFDHGK